MNNQDKKEMLLMIAECVQSVRNKYTDGGTNESSILGLMASELHSKAHDLFTDKPKREMPEDGETYLFIVSAYIHGFIVEEVIWNKYSSDNSDLWNSGRAFLLSERELAEKKVAELNKILAS